MLYTAYIIIPSSPVMTEMGLVKGPFPADVCAERNTTYDVWGCRESTVVALVLEKYSLVSPLFNCLMTIEYPKRGPFQSPGGGGSHVRETEREEEMEDGACGALAGTTCEGGYEI